MTSHRSFKRLIAAAALVGLGLCCAVGTALAEGTWLPENISTLGERIDRMYQIIFVLVTVIFFLTEGALLYFIVRYRQKPGRRAVYFHDHKGLEAIWWIVPGAILFWLAIYQWDAWAEARLRPPDAATAVKVQILAQQFEWNIRYAGPDGEFATGDDVVLKNQMFIPEGKNILVQMRAVDVIHSFFLPNLRVKQDIVPGTTTLVWFDATKTGDYEIACSELCGLGHYRMRAQLFIRTAEEFDAWLQEKYNANATPAKWGWSWEEGV
jgi:cytochrome c oxidase subunit 2